MFSILLLESCRSLRMSLEGSTDRREDGGWFLDIFGYDNIRAVLAYHAGPEPQGSVLL